MKKLLAIAFLGSALVGCERMDNGDNGRTGVDRDKGVQPTPAPTTPSQTNNAVPTTPTPEPTTPPK